MEAKIKQLLENLLNNGEQYIFETGSCSIAYNLDENKILLSYIKDVPKSIEPFKLKSDACSSFRTFDHENAEEIFELCIYPISTTYYIKFEDIVKQATMVQKMESQIINFQNKTVNDLNEKFNDL